MLQRRPARPWAAALLVALAVVAAAAVAEAAGLPSSRGDRDLIGYKEASLSGSDRPRGMTVLVRASAQVDGAAQRSKHPLVAAVPGTVSAALRLLQLLPLQQQLWHTASGNSICIKLLVNKLSCFHMPQSWSPRIFLFSRFLSDGAAAGLCN